MVSVLLGTFLRKHLNKSAIRMLGLAIILILSSMFSRVAFKLFVLLLLLLLIIFVVLLVFARNWDLLACSASFLFETEVDCWVCCWCCCCCFCFCGCFVCCGGVVVLKLSWADDEDESSSKLAGSNGKSSRIERTVLWRFKMIWFGSDSTTRRRMTSRFGCDYVIRMNFRRWQYNLIIFTVE